MHIKRSVLFIQLCQEKHILDFFGDEQHQATCGFVRFGMCAVCVSVKKISGRNATLHIIIRSHLSYIIIGFLVI